MVVDAVAEAWTLGGPLAALLHQRAGSWTPVFGMAITFDILTAVLAIAVLKPMRRRFLLTQRGA